MRLTSSVSRTASDAFGHPAPLVSVVLTTRDRPRFLQIALRCYTHQTYPRKELVVVDDGSRWPVDPVAVADAGGRLVRVEPGTPLGTKLNRGISVSTGALCQKMDDDDWYAPDFLQCMVRAWRNSQRYISWPIVAAYADHPIFDLTRWEIRSVSQGAAGGTLLFAREVWEQRPFRPLVKSEDGWFLLDQHRLGTRLLQVDGQDIFMLVRHSGIGVDRGHTWRYWQDQTVDEIFTHLRTHKRPEDLLPSGALTAYTEIRGSVPVTPRSSRHRRV